MDTKVYARRRPEGGFSLLEMMIVIGIISIAAGLSIPQVIGARRALRATSLVRELSGGLRDARQMALSRRRAITFQYDDATKQVNIIDHGTNADGLGISGVDVLTDGNYPDTTNSSVASTASLIASGLPAAEIKYGVPSDVPTAARTLGDKTTLTALTDERLNITFQPDGTIIGTTGVHSNVAFAIYNSVQPHGTAAAISILGATGRVKVWRYSDSAQKFVE
ncbi:MAG: prepilin-type N-terminal cleavage/methylation domain-containing protein [Pyrinomonadaceae bacterium]